ncbi:MAG: hypothetical protein R2867_42260 [Caldilineaceae bacterium]
MAIVGRQHGVDGRILPSAPKSLMSWRMWAIYIGLSFANSTGIDVAVMIQKKLALTSGMLH